MLLLPVSIYLYFFAEEIISLVLGEQWGDAVIVFQWLIIFLVCRLNYKFSDLLAAALGAVYRRAMRQSLYAAAVIVGSYIGHFFGVEGVAAGVGLAITLNYILMLQLSQALIGFSWKAVVFMHLKQLCIAIPLAVLIYFSKLYFFYELDSLFFLFLLSGLFFIFVTILLWFAFAKAMRRELEVIKIIFGYKVDI